MYSCIVSLDAKGPEGVLIVTCHITRSGGWRQGQYLVWPSEAVASAAAGHDDRALSDSLLENMIARGDANLVTCIGV